MQCRCRSRAFEGSSSSGAEVLYRRKDGGEFWAAVFISPVRDEGGDIVQYFASFVDLTEHKEDEARLKMLIDELNHRVKNTLSTVQSIVWQTLRTTSDPKVIRESIESRLFALSRSHDLLTREKWEGAGLLDIIHDALEPFGVSGGGRIVLLSRVRTCASRQNQPWPLALCSTSSRRMP
ncbi:HWE histidine kinase domain-containing protein [Bradyrhizobium sp. NP1]|uniref:HWE histidine kinase domain-containing protein n=1 Tax=Bradyrhizobium sp. NP1 TaxID=3049772 RepID=UPI0025A57CEC|nr:HWE histidine kinase domain-containing protein [Bradyrhizobium sp. NP1]WJR82038.1 HWE histidine kinase domain-containing protein [Bradyrhizobium sp. NP1]